MSEPLSILLDDDDENVRRLYALILRNYGHKVETAEDGAAALEAVRLRPGAFDLIITDHQMPHLDGIGLVRDLKSTPYRGALIVYSGALSGELVELYRELGVTESLRKPVSLSNLFDALAGIPKTRVQPAIRVPKWPQAASPEPPEGPELAP
jgi:two-component system chemotaxis response regulator CheY